MCMYITRIDERPKNNRAALRCYYYYYYYYNYYYYYYYYIVTIHAVRPSVPATQLVVRSVETCAVIVYITYI